MPQSLAQWATRWGVPQAAIDDLARSCIYTSESDDGKSEARQQSEVRLEAVAHSTYLFRNNVGAGSVVDPKRLCAKCFPLAKRFIRWGLANDSAGVNKVLKSADLIGIRKRFITAKDVGSFIGQFYSREVKHSDWKYSGSEDELAQMKWTALINSQGGDAKIVTGPGSL